MQYFRRQTKVARGVIAISSVLFVVVLELLPSGPLFAFQQHLSPHPNAAKSMSLFFDASLGKYQQPSGLTGLMKRRGNNGRSRNHQTAYLRARRDWARPRREMRIGQNATTLTCLSVRPKMSQQQIADRHDR
jgi:hypothetical protein